MPAWCAFVVDPHSLRLPPRDGRLAAFRAAADGTSPRDYANSGFARGHIVPYAVLGGDYDGDGRTAADGDADDERAILEANTMDNIAPQDQAGVNGPTGPWYHMETLLRDLARREGKPIYVVAGVVPGGWRSVGPVAVPPAFFQVAAWGDGPQVLAVLVPHFREPRPVPLGAYCVPVDVIEDLIGWDLLPELPEAVEAADTYSTWVRVNGD